jgi:hypothetical protein
MVISFIPKNGSVIGTNNRFHISIDKTKVDALPWYKVFLKMDLILKERAHLDQK